MYLHLVLLQLVLPLLLQILDMCFILRHYLVAVFLVGLLELRDLVLQSDRFLEFHIVFLFELSFHLGAVLLLLLVLVVQESYLLL